MSSIPATDPTTSPWLTPREAAVRARTGLRTIYRAAASGQLRAARVGGRRELRFLAAWVDAWLVDTTQPIETAPRLLMTRERRA